MFSFDLVFRLPPTVDHDWAVDRLFEAGMLDVTPGIGQDGYVALAFERPGTSADTVIRDSIAEAERALPGATLTEVGPHLVTIRELGYLFGVSWQAFQRRARESADFPAPIRSAAPRLWRLVDVVNWVDVGRTRFKTPAGLAEVARCSAALCEPVGGRASPSRRPVSTGRTQATSRVAAAAAARERETV